MFLEVALEQDMNDTYNATVFPSPTGIRGRTTGSPSRSTIGHLQGPFTVSDTETIATTDTYAGYSDPTGADGTLRAPDATITTNVPNTGASRLLMTSKDGSMFRVRVDTRPEFDYIIPGTPQNMGVAETTERGATITFVAPGDDGFIGKVKGYDVRYLVGDVPIDERT
jgi:hypothetical protein